MSSLLNTRLSIDATAYVAPGATLVGEVSVGARASVWFGAVLRGDLAPVHIGDESNVQDNAILHVEVDGPARLGRRVTVGHGAIVHAADVGDDCLIGIGAIVLSGARIGRGCIIGAGAVVKEGFEIPPGSVVFGVPGKVVRPVTADEAKRIDGNWRAYVAYAEAYRSGRMNGSPESAAR
ncbi:MAG: gamma carbonic anhydrase family protein [Acidobacteria bacterium]|nr:gamma carbonic anhydrase family protein [Acidobacteriota bacterium]